jgi:hypothetical protein
VKRLSTVVLTVCVLAHAVGGRAQDQLSATDVARLDAAVREAFSFLYALPRDTAAAQMGTWVLDSTATTAAVEHSAERRIVITKLTDTGRDLEMKQVAGGGGTSPAQLAAAMQDMQRLEGKVSKAEADAGLEVVVAANASETSLPGVSDDTERSRPAIPGSQIAVRMKGAWMRLQDKELEIDYERWSPATLLVGFGSFAPLETRRATPNETAATVTLRTRRTAGANQIRSITVTVQGNEELIDRVVQEARWAALAALLN